MHGNNRAANITMGILDDGWASFSKSGELVWDFSRVMRRTRVLQTRRSLANFFQDGEDLLDNMHGVDKFLVAGDFNSHLSKNANEEFGIAGSRDLDTPSTRRAYQMLESMASQSLSIVDRHFACNRRGTWWNSSNKKWYENDVFMRKGTIDIKSVSKLKTCTMAGCDHRLKILHFCLPGPRPKWTKVSPEGKDVFIDGFGVTRKRGKIRWDVARGPSKGAKKRRERFQIEAGTRWENMGKPESWDGISEALAGAAAEVCGRGHLPGDLRCTSFRRDEILEKRAEVQATYGKLTTSRGTDFELQARAEHRKKETITAV